jgi:hypothetical protein
MNVTLSSFSEVHGEVRGYWECRVLASALLWAFPALSRGNCTIEYKESPLQTNRPSFWPAGVNGAPLNVEMPSHSDFPGMRSLRDEANMSWDKAFVQMQERGEWMRLMGAAPCMADTLLLPFQELHFVLRFEGKPEKFRELVDALTAESQYPETRLFGYGLIHPTPYNPKITAPGWVSTLL